MPNEFFSNSQGRIHRSLIRSTRCHFICTSVIKGVYIRPLAVLRVTKIFSCQQPGRIYTFFMCFVSSQLRIYIRSHKVTSYRGSFWRMYEPICIKGFSSPFRFDRNSPEGGILLFSREETQSNFLSEYKPNTSVRKIFIKINLRSKKWLLSCCCNPNLTLLNNHIQNTSRIIGFYSSKNNNFIVLGEFNAEISSTTFSQIWANYNRKKL